MGNKPYQPQLFNTLLEACAQADAAHRSALVDTFAAEVRKFGAPLLESINTVLFLYRGAGERVDVIGDLNDWDQATPLVRVPGTDLFYLRATAQQGGAECAVAEATFLADGQVGR